MDDHFHLHGIGCSNGQSLLHIANEFCEPFQKPPPSNIVVLAVIKKFHCMGNFITQYKDFNGYPVTITRNVNRRWLAKQVLQYLTKHLSNWILMIHLQEEYSNKLVVFIYKIQMFEKYRQRSKNCLLCFDVSNDLLFLSNECFSDESHIHPKGFINRHNLFSWFWIVRHHCADA